MAPVIGEQASGGLPCAEQAYVGLLTVHPPRAGWKTFIAQQGRKFDTQINLLRVLLRSLRAHETTCKRDFVLLLGPQTGLSHETERALRLDGIKLFPAPPLLLGVPTLDKLHAWRLTNYSKVLFIDTDSMILRPIDDAFALPEFAMAAHPYDTVQGAACGLPIGGRGVTGLFLLAPSESRYEQLLSHSRSHSRLWDAELTRHTPEQCGLACFFHNISRLHTWPCSYMFDIGNDGHTRNAQHHRGCRRWQNKAECDAIADHISASCTWQRVHTRARAVHFKGSLKPWRGISEPCAPMKRGRLRLLLDGPDGPAGGASTATATSAAVAATDDLAWDTMRRRCVSVLTRAPVRWGAPPEQSSSGGAAAVPRKCCVFQTLIKAEWHAHLASVSRAAARGTS